MDAEQTGSEIRPSDIREEQQYDSESYSLTGEARDMTAARIRWIRKRRHRKPRVSMVRACPLTAKTYCKEIDHDTQRQIAGQDVKCSPLLTMESDSDIETIAESIVNLSDSDGDFFKKTEKLLLMAALGYLRDWCEPSQRTIGNLISLLDAALPKDNETHTTLDNLFYEMKSGCKRVKSEDGITTLWEPSVLSRCDGLTPRDSNGIDVSEDFSLTCYEGFRHAATRETRTSIVTTLLLVLEEVEKEDAIWQIARTRKSIRRLPPRRSAPSSSPRSSSISVTVMPKPSSPIRADFRPSGRCHAHHVGDHRGCAVCPRYDQ